MLHKALAGDLHQRYVSASAFENDLTLFLQNRPTVAEMERRVSWKSNPTVEKQRLPHLPERVASMAETVRRSVLKLKPPRVKQTGFGDEHFGGAVLGIAGGAGGVRAARLLLSILAREQRAARQLGLHARQRRRDQPGLGFAAARPKAECVPGRDVAGQPTDGERAGGVCCKRATR